MRDVPRHRALRTGRILLLGLLAAFVGLPGGALHAVVHATWTRSGRVGDAGAGAPCRPRRCPDRAALCPHDREAVHVTVCLGCSSPSRPLGSAAGADSVLAPPALGLGSPPSSDRAPRRRVLLAALGPRAPPPSV